MADFTRGITPYHYVCNNPIALFDPTGMWTETATGYATNDPDEIAAFCEQMGISGNDDGDDEPSDDDVAIAEAKYWGGVKTNNPLVSNIRTEMEALKEWAPGLASFYEFVMQQEGLTAADVAMFAAERSSQYQGLLQMKIFSPENVGTILLLWSPAKLPTTRGSTMLAKQMPMLRKAYSKAVSNLKGFSNNLLKQGYSKEATAKILHSQRRYLGHIYKNATPAKTLEKIYSRNLAKYGDKYGPTIKWLRQQGKSWDDIISSASRSGGKDLGF